MLNHIWNIFEKCLTTTVFSTLKVIKIRNHRHNNKKNKPHPPEFKKYRKSLTLLKALNKTIEVKSKEHLECLNQQIQDFNKDNPTLQPIKIHKDINEIKTTDWNIWKKEIKESIQALRNESVKIENQVKNRQIEAAITQRCMDFKDNQKKIIFSLTDNHKNSIYIDRIMVEQKDKEKFISTDPAKIKL